MDEMFPMSLGPDGNVWDEPDIVLAYIVTALVNGMGVEIGVTLMAHGLVMSGTLVSEQQYLSNVTDMLIEQVDFTDSDIPEETRDALKSVLDVRNLGEFDPLTYAAEAENDEMADQMMPPLLQYLHLQDPLVVAGESPIQFQPGGGVTVRLRLTSIDGWMLGEIRPDFGGLGPFDDDDQVKH